MDEIFATDQYEAPEGLGQGQGLSLPVGKMVIYRGAEYAVNFLPKIKIEVAVTDDLLEQVIETIQKSANTGQIGDGKLFVVDLQTAVRIRTGDTGSDAL